MFDVTRPDWVAVDGLALEPSGPEWGGSGASVSFGEAVVLHAAEASLVHVRYPVRFGSGVEFLGDAWERGYGDLHWGASVGRRMPWYFVGIDERVPFGVGVRTGANAMVWWEVDADGIHLYADVRSGGSPVQLANGELEICSIVAIQGESDRSPFGFAQQFCRQLCSVPILPSEPVWGFNDWYYAYGSSTRDSILRDTETLVGLRPTVGSSPFSVIDMGWAVGYPKSDGGPQDAGNAKFGDMAGLAEAIRQKGARPGIWMRPLYTLPVPSLRVLHPEDGRGCVVLDPSDPEVLEYVRRDTARCADWGYELIKHDFTTFDLLGRWGFEMADGITADGWSFADRSRTTAQIIRTLYQTIHEAAGEALIIGCNTVGHLIARHAHLQRTGDDTSGREWARTLKMGVNTLAFRMPQHDAFFAVDADCVGLTNDVPWDKNAQWLDLLSRSGTPLFVSADPAALGVEQGEALRKAFARAAVARDVAEPLDWRNHCTPSEWRTSDGEHRYDW
jgi:alpha-galactosidase